MTSPAAAKVAEQIKVIAAAMLERRIEDPRLGFLTITDARLSRDWRRCDLFYTVLGDAEAWAQSAAALEQAKGQIRTQVSRQLKLRFAPEIVFQPDGLPEQSSHLEAVFAAVRERDAQVADLAVGAEYAGEPDPYKTDADLDAEADLDDEADAGGLEAVPDSAADPAVAAPTGEAAG
jgi:ribosome-binding factor A